MSGRSRPAFPPRAKLRSGGDSVYSVFPSSNKLPRYIGLDPDSIEDVHLREKLNGYVNAMGFESINDYRIHDILNIDPNLSSRDQILALEDNLHRILG